MKANVVGESRESPGLLPWICNTQLLSPSLQHKASAAGCLPRALPEQAPPRYCTTQMTAGTGRNDDSSSKWKLASLEGFLWQLPGSALKLLVVLGGQCWLQAPLGVFLRGKQVAAFPELIFKDKISRKSRANWCCRAVGRPEG